MIEAKRLVSFGFSEIGELDKLYIPLLADNPYIEAICLDSDKLSPSHEYIRTAFMNKRSVHKLHFRGS